MEELNEIFGLFEHLEGVVDVVHNERNPKALSAFHVAELNLHYLARQLGFRIIQNYKVIEDFDLLDAQVVNGILTVSCMPARHDYTSFISFEFDREGLKSIKRYSNPYSNNPQIYEMG